MLIRSDSDVNFVIIADLLLHRRILMGEPCLLNELQLCYFEGSALLTLVNRETQW